MRAFRPPNICAHASEEAAALGTKEAPLPFPNVQEVCEDCKSARYQGTSLGTAVPEMEPLIDFAAYAHRAAERFMTHSLFAGGMKVFRCHHLALPT